MTDNGSKNNPFREGNLMGKVLLNSKEEKPTGFNSYLNLPNHERKKFLLEFVESRKLCIRLRSGSCELLVPSNKRTIVWDSEEDKGLMIKSKHGCSIEDMAVLHGCTTITVIERLKYLNTQPSVNTWKATEQKQAAPSPSKRRLLLLLQQSTHQPQL